MANFQKGDRVMLTAYRDGCKKGETGVILDGPSLLDGRYTVSVNGRKCYCKPNEIAKI